VVTKVIKLINFEKLILASELKARGGLEYYLRRIGVIYPSSNQN